MGAIDLYFYWPAVSHTYIIITFLIILFTWNLVTFPLLYVCALDKNAAPRVGSWN